MNKLDFGLGLLLLSATQIPVLAAPSAGATTHRLIENYERSSVVFEQNVGQAPQGTDFLGRGLFHALSLKANGATFTRATDSQPGIKLTLLNSNTAAKSAGVDRAPGHVNYMLGTDRSRWLFNVPVYQKVRYREVWPGIDIVYYGTQSRLEYDFVVNPGADLHSIQLQFSGTRSLRVNTAGDLMLETSEGTMEQRRPRVYQQMDGRLVDLDGQYVLGAGNTVRFAVSKYDRTRELVIDPVLIYGKSGASERRTAVAVALDSLGNSYYVGQLNQIFADKTSQLVGYVSKLDSSGATASYSATTFGGRNQPTSAAAVTIDSSDQIYIAGTTGVDGYFSIGDGVQSHLAGGTDAYLLKLDGDLKAVYATYLGGTGNDTAKAVAVDGTRAYVVGQTVSADFPATVGLGPVFHDNSTGMGFAVAIDTAAGEAGKLWATLLGGSGTDSANGVVSNGKGVITIGGSTSSADFQPSSTVGFSPTKTNGANLDGFVVVLGPEGRNPSYFTYWPYGPIQGIAGMGSAVYATGATNGNISTTPSGYKLSPSGTSDAFVTKLNTDLSGTESLLYASYLGGSGDDAGYGISADSQGNAYIVGRTGSTDYHTTPGSIPLPSRNAAPYGFLTIVNTTASGANGLVFSTFLSAHAASAGVTTAGLANAAPTDAVHSNVATGVGVDAFGNVVVAATGSGTPSNAQQFAFASSVLPVATVSPATGTGPSQSFNITLTDPNGYTDIAGAGIVINSTLSGVNACYVLFARPDQISLVDDTGIPAAGHVTTTSLGAPAVLQNSQCVVLASQTTQIGSGNTVQLTLTVVFKAAFAGAKSVWVNVNNNAGQTTGFQQLGSYNSTGPTQSLAATSVSPATGSGQAQAFTFSYFDPFGAPDISGARLVFNSGFTLAGGCYLQFDSANNISLASDDGNTLVGTAKLGKQTTIQNSQCIVYPGNSYQTQVGQTLTVTVFVAFKPSFAGAKNVYSDVQNNAGTRSAFPQLGTYTVSASAPLSVNSVSPPAATGPSQLFKFVYADPNGYTDIAGSQVIINPSASTSNSCVILFNRAAGTIALNADSGSGATGVPLGQATALSNTQCIVNVAASSQFGFGNYLTLSLFVTMKTSGTQSVYSSVTSNAPATAGPVQVGTWAVSSPALMTPVAVSPFTGAGTLGTGQSFTFTLSNPAGSSNISGALMVLYPSLQGAGACYILWGHNSNLFSLAADNAQTFTSAPAGTSGLLTNSQCSVDPQQSFATETGNTVNLTVFVTFKNIYQQFVQFYSWVNVQNRASQLSGWSLLSRFSAETPSSLLLPIGVPNLNLGQGPATSITLSLLTMTACSTPSASCGSAGTGGPLVVLDPNTQVPVGSPYLAPAGGVIGTLASGDASKVLVSGAQQAGFVVPQGQSTTSLPLTGLANSGAVLLTATAPGFPVGRGTVTLTSPGLTVTSTSLKLGQTASLPINLTSAAPSGGITINLSSSDPTKVVASGSIFIASGATAPAVAPQVTGAGIGSATITASAPGYLSATGTVTVTAPTMTFNGSPLSISIPSPGTGTLTLNLANGQAPAGGLSVSLSSDNTTKATVPATVSFAPGATTATVTVTGVASGAANITATATGIPAATAVVNVVNQPSIAVTPTNVNLGLSATLPITLSVPAPAGGLTLNLTSSDSSKVVIPATIFIAAGATSPSVPVQVTAAGIGSATITASVAGYVTGTGIVTVQPPSMSFSPSLLSITVPSPGSGTLSLTLTNGKAPAGGLAISLSSSDSAKAIVPGVITFAAGATTLNVPVTGFALGNATITAAATGITSATATISISSQPTVSVANTTINLGQTASLAVALSTAAPAGGTTISLSSSDSTKVVTPPTVFIPVGATTPLTLPQVTGSAIGSAVITASATGYITGTGTVTVAPPVLSFGGSPLTIVFPSPGTGNLTLNLTNGQPPPGGLTVNLTSGDPTKVVVPASVTFGAGVSSVNVPVTALAAGNGIIITASAPNITSANASVTVANQPTVSVPNTTISLGQTANLQVSLSAPAPSGGVTVNLSSSDGTKVIVPANVLIPAGATTPLNLPQVTGAGIGSATITASANGYIGGSGTVTVAPPVMSFTGSPLSITIPSPGTGTLTLNLTSGQAPAGGLTVNLSSLDPGKATVPSTVTLAAGATSGVFTVTGVAVGQTVITASAPGIVSTTATVNVLSLPSITVANTNINVGQTANLQVALLQAAPAGGLTVNLSNSDPGKVIAPTSVFIAAGATTPATPPQVTGANIGSATITASATGYLSGSGIVTVGAPSMSFSGSPLSITLPNPGSGTLTLNLVNGQAPAGGLVVSLSSSDTGKATVPATVTVAAGATSAIVTVTGVATGSATITASASGIQSAAATVNVSNLPSISVANTSVNLGQTSNLQITLQTAAPASGVTVNLSSSDSSKVVVPASVFIAGGATSPSVAPQVTAAGIGPATITASAVGYIGGSGTVTVTPPSMGFSGSPLSITLPNPGTGTLTLNLINGQAPVGGLVISLSSTNTSNATVPASVTIPAGGTSATFTVTGVAVGPATITATSPGIQSATATVNVSNLPTINVANVSVNLGQTSNLQITLQTVAPAGGVTVNLSSSDTNKVTVPSSVFIAAGATTPSVAPQVTGVNLGSATINASAVGYIGGSGTVTVAAPSMGFTGSPLSITLPTPGTGTLTLNLINGQAPAGGLVVTLSSSDTSKATVPASVTVPAGGTSATVNVTGVAIGTATITATAPGIQSATATVNVSNLPSINIANTNVNLGQTANLAVSLSSVAPSAVTVNLSSSDSSKVITPSSVTIAAGATSPATPLQITGAGIGSATITGTATGYVTGTGTATVPSPLLAFGGSPLSITIPSPGTGTLTVNLTNGQAPAGGLTVSLSSSNPGFATVPATVNLAAGATSATVNVTAVAAGSTTITASAPGIAAATATVNVSNQPAIGVTAASVNLGFATGLQITLPAPAPAGGLTVNLSSSDTGKVTIPASVVIAAGATTPASAPQVTGVGIGSATITASANGYLNGAAVVTVAAPTMAFAGSPLSITFPTPGTGTLTINLTNGKAPAGGLAVSLSSSDSSKATVPATANFAAGANSAQVTVTAVAIGTATITASAAGITSATATVNVTNPAVLTVPPNLSVGLGLATAYSVTLSQGAPAGGVTVNLTSSDSGKVQVSPASVFIAAGATAPATQPQITGTGVGSATITASASGFASVNTAATVPTPTLSFVGGDITVNAGNSVPVELTLVNAVAPSGGLIINVITNPSSIATVSGPTSIPAGAKSIVVNVLGVSAGSAILSANGPGIPVTSQNITVLPAISPLIQPIIVPSISVGKGLQSGITISLLTMTACAAGDKLPLGESCQPNGPKGALVIVTSGTGVPILFPLQAPSPVSMSVTSSDPSKLLISLRSACPGVATPTQTTICGAQQVITTIPQNLSTTSVFLQGFANSGTATITASAQGYPTGQATITLTPSGFVLSGPSGSSNFTTFAGAPASPITVSTARLDASLNFAEFQQLRSGYNDPINGPFDDGQGTITCNKLFNTPTDIQNCEAQGKFANNNLSGIFSTSATISSTSPGVAGVLAPVPFAGGDSANTGQMLPTSAGVATLSVTPPSGFSSPASGNAVVVNVNAPQTTCATVTVGKNLETTISCTLLGGVPSSGLPVTITSNSPNLKFSAIPLHGTTCTDAGANQININTVNAAQGGVNIVIPAFCVYGLADSGSATYAVAVQGYATATGTVNLAPSGFVVAGPGGIGSASFDVFGPTATVTVYSALLDSNLNYVAQQALAVGQSVSVNLTSSNPTVGNISPSTLPFTGGQVSNSTTFTSGNGALLYCTANPQPTDPPCTIVTAVAPAGFSTPSKAGSVMARVPVQNLSLSCGDAATPTVIGKDLQAACTVSIPAFNPAPAGGILVTIHSNAAAQLLASNTANSLGLSTITVTIPGGSTQSAAFYLQSLGSSGSATYTASASGYPNRTGTVSMAPSGIVISGPYGLGAGYFNTSLAAGNIALTVYTAVLETNVSSTCGNPPCLLGTQPLRGGIPALSITVTSGNTSVATVTSPATIAAGGTGTASVQFKPLTTGPTVITIVQPSGFQAGSVTTTSLNATVTP